MPVAVRVLYRDSSLIVCEKPVGVSSESPGLPDLVSAQLGLAVYPVHRLDQTTGGVCILACSPQSCTSLQSLFQQDRIVKEYLAVIAGVPKAGSGSWSDLLYHDRRTNKTYIADKMRKGVKEAFCEWMLLETVEKSGNTMSLVRVRLHSGRTHQIRVQFASRQMPLVGDRRYGSRIRADVPALWSARISFPHPFFAEKTVDIVSCPPDAFPWNAFSKSYDTDHIPACDNMI